MSSFGKRVNKESRYASNPRMTGQARGVSPLEDVRAYMSGDCELDVLLVESPRDSSNAREDLRWQCPRTGTDATELLAFHFGAWAVGKVRKGALGKQCFNSVRAFSADLDQTKGVF